MQTQWHPKQRSFYSHRPKLREPHLINKHDHFLDADLFSEQHVLLCLWHHTICGSYHQYGAFHLRRARDHVLDVVGMTGGRGSLYASNDAPP